MDEHGHDDVPLPAAVGSTTALTSVSVSGGTTDINGGSVKTSGTQDYDNVVLTPAATLTTTNSNVSIHGTSLLTAGLSVSDGTGNTTFTGTVDGPGALTVTSTGTTTFNGAVGTHHGLGERLGLRRHDRHQRRERENKRHAGLRQRRQYASGDAHHHQQ